MRNLVKRAIRGVEEPKWISLNSQKAPGGRMYRFTSLWLLWVSAIGGLVFLVVHAVWLKFFAKPEAFEAIPPAVPPRPRTRSYAIRWRPGFSTWCNRQQCWPCCHGFSPQGWLPAPWVKWHWMAGLVLGASIIFHIIHATSTWISGPFGQIRSDIEDSFRK